MDPEEFRANGHRVVDQITDFYASLPQSKVTTGEPPAQIRAVLGNASLPELPEPNDLILGQASHHSLHNGHPLFAGYVTSSAAPIGVLADPMATEMEVESIRWIAEFLGYPADCGGILVSGGNMANFIGFPAARKQACPAIRAEGTRAAQLIAYASRETNTWVQKAVDLFGRRTAGLQPFFIAASAGAVSTHDRDDRTTPASH